MTRTLGIVLAGAVIGAVTTLAVVGGGSEPITAAAPVMPVSERLTAYRTAAAIDDIDALEAAVGAAAAEPESAARDVGIDASLLRLAELDPARAVGLAVSLDLAERVVVSALRTSAHADPESALRALAAIADPGLRRAAALGLLDVLGDDAAGVARVTAALPVADRAPLLVDRLVSHAEIDPAAALREALGARDPKVQRQAALSIGEVWVRQDPLAALAEADAMRAPLEAEYRARVVEAWARVDAAGYLSYLEAFPAQREFNRAVLWLAAADPRRSLELAARLEGDFGEGLMTLARDVLAQRDPDAARAYAESMPAGSDRDQLLAQTAAAYARSDPEAALEWLDAQPQASVDLQRSVLGMIVAAHPGRAGKLLERLPDGVDVRSAMSFGIATGDPASFVVLAESLMGSADDRASLALSDLAFNWVQQNPDSALGWIEANSSALDPLFLGNAARALASRDPTRAASFADRLPLGAREAWMLVVAEPYARTNPSAALAWIARYQGQPGYGAALRQVVARASQSDPETSAVLLSQAGAEVQLGSATAVASSWAGRDPAAAARWAQSLADPRARSASVTAVVTSWAARDLGSARGWSLSMPRGDLRDEALSIVLSQTAAAGRIDRAVLDAFGSDSLRQRRLVGLMPAIARRGRDEAQDLVDAYVRDPALRQQAAQYIEAAQRSP